MLHIIIPAVIAAAFVLWLIMIAPRLKYKQKTGHLKNSCFAHRGLHGNGIPENSLSAFKKAKESSCGIELDVHMTKDGYFAVMHDEDLLRMCGVDVKISCSLKKDISNYYLSDSSEKIPFLEDIITEFENIPLLIELKPTDLDTDEMIKKLFDILDGHRGEYYIQSFDPRILRKVRKYRKDVLCGQLAGYINKSGYKIEGYIDVAIRNLIVNIISRPDFISYRFEDRKNICFRTVKNIFGIPVLYWTIRNNKDADAVKEDGCGIIFENITI